MVNKRIGGIFDGIRFKNEGRFANVRGIAEDRY